MIEAGAHLAGLAVLPDDLVVAVDLEHKFVRLIDDQNVLMGERRGKHPAC